MVSLTKQIQHSSKWTQPCKSYCKKTPVKWLQILLSLPVISLLTNLLFHRQNKDLHALSSLGHFLKGSSATLGLTKVKDSCEKIQHFGARKDEAGNDAPYDDAKYLSLVKSTLDVVKAEYKEAERILRQFYRDSEVHS